MRLLIVAVAMIMTVWCPSSLAHTRSQSFSNWSWDDHNVSFTFAVDARRITQLVPLYEKERSLPSLLEAHLKETIRVNQNTTPCTLTNLTALGEGHSRVHVAGQFNCDAAIDGNTTVVTVAAFFRVSPTHIHIARLETKNDFHDFSLREGVETFELVDTPVVNTMSGFIAAGFSHVLSGVDHILFLIALALIARGPRLALWCILGFTAGHSATLGLAMLGLVTPDAAMIEVLIGYTIAVWALEAASEYGLERQRALTGFAALTALMFAFQLPALSIAGPGLALAVFVLACSKMSRELMLSFLPVMTVFFGLIHGAGFARGLTDANILRNELLRPLLGFNIGVELAQILILLLAYTAVRALRLLESETTRHVLQTTCVVIFAAGCFWFTARLFQP